MSKSKSMMGLVLTAALLWASCPQASLAQDDPRSLLTMGRKQENEARGKKSDERDQVLVRALEIYRSITERWPQAGEPVAEAWLRMGDIERRRQNADAALAAYHAVLEGTCTPTQKALALAAEATIHLRNKRPVEAAGRWERIVNECGEDHRSTAEACLDLARLAKKQKRWRTAMSWAQKVLDERPELWRENVEAAEVLCGVLVATHRWNEAVGRLAELDAFLEKRFGDGDHAESVRRAMEKMTVRRQLTPLPLDGREGDEDD